MLPGASRLARLPLRLWLKTRAPVTGFTCHSLARFHRPDKNDSLRILSLSRSVYLLISSFPWKVGTRSTFEPTSTFQHQPTRADFSLLVASYLNYLSLGLLSVFRAGSSFAFYGRFLYGDNITRENAVRLCMY